jgi:hypothetical protein
MRTCPIPRAAGAAGAALAAAAVLAAAGCGGSGSSTTSATDWANGVCSSIVTWENSLKSISSSLQANPSKDAVQTAVNDAKSATDTLAKDLKKLGKPDTTAGKQAKDAVDTLTSQLQSDVDKIESAIKDASGASGYLNAISVVSGTISSMGTEISTTAKQIQSLDAQGELQKAFSQADSCSTLKKG